MSDDSSFDGTSEFLSSAILTSSPCRDGCGDPRQGSHPGGRGCHQRAAAAATAAAAAAKRAGGAAAAAGAGATGATGATAAAAAAAAAATAATGATAAATPATATQTAPTQEECWPHTSCRAWWPHQDEGPEQKGKRKGPR